jgi:hypothetical protein
MISAKFFTRKCFNFTHYTEGSPYLRFYNNSVQSIALKKQLPTLGSVGSRGGELQ